MHPEVLHVGFLHLRSYGLMMAIAFVVGTALSLREARRLSLDEDKVVNVILVTLVASVLGARMLYVLEHLGEFRREWTSVLALWQGGLTLYGGVVAGTFAGLVAARRMEKSGSRGPGGLGMRGQQHGAAVRRELAVLRPHEDRPGLAGRKVPGPARIGKEGDGVAPGVVQRRDGGDQAPAQAGVSQFRAAGDSQIGHGNRTQGLEKAGVRHANLSTTAVPGIARYGRSVGGPKPLRVNAVTESARPAAKAGRALSGA
jgi:hypothetical protein